MKNKVGIILVNYKDYARRFLGECRDSLRIQTYPQELFSVYIVDNESSQESVNDIKEIYPEANIIYRQDGNYAAANNAGIKKGIEDGCELFVVANMDTKMDKDWLGELVLAVSGEDIGIAQSLVMLYPSGEEKEGEQKINTIGNIIHFLGFGFTDGYGKRLGEVGLESTRKELMYASGCSLVIKKEVLEKIDFYDDEYYMYHDDLEVGWKTRLAGYKIILAEKSVIYHKYEFSRSVRMIYYMERNRLITLFIFYKLETLVFLIPAILFMDLGMLFYSFVNGWWREKLKIYAYFLSAKNWEKIGVIRAKVQSLRVISDEEAIKNYFGRIEFQEIENPILKYLVNPVLDLYWHLIKKIIKW